MAFRKHFLTAFFALFCMGLTACEKPAEKEARYIKEGNELFEKGDYIKARLNYKNAIQLMPSDAEPRYRLGLVDEAEGDAQNAFGAFMSAEQQNAHFRPALLKLANYFLVIGQYDEADHRLNVVLGEKPDDAEGHALRGAVLLRRKEYDGAEKEARLALAAEPANITAFAVLTGLYSAQNNEDKAEAALAEGLKRNPDDMSLLLLQATYYEKTGKLDKIAAAYKALFKVKPTAEMFRADLAKIYVKFEKKPEAETTLREGVTVIPDSWAMKKDLVDFLSKHEGVDAAEKEIRNLMQAFPKNDELYFWLADVYIQHDATDRAQQLLEQIVARDQVDSASLNASTSLARIHFIKGDKSLAQKLVTAVLAKNAGNQEALFIRAQMSFGLGHYQDAVSDLRTIIRDNPKAAPAFQLLAETLLLQGHLDLAIDTQTQLVEMTPTDPAPAVRLAQMMLMNGNEKRSGEIFENATKISPTYPVAWESLARASITTHNFETAQRAIATLDKLEGQHKMVQFLTGQLLEAKGKRAEALPYYSETFSADPTSPLSEHALSAFIEAKQSLNQLADAAATLMALKPESPFITTLIGGCFQKLGRTAEASAFFDKAIAANTGAQDAYIGKAQILAATGKQDEAVQLLKTARDKTPADIRAPMIAADMLGKAGKYQDAIALYSDVLAQSPDSDLAANNMAQMIADYLYTDATSLEKARQTAERFAASKNPLYLDTLGWVYFRQGNMQQAQVIMERVMAAPHDKFPEEVHYHYGSLLLKLGKIQEAKAELAQATAPGAHYPGLDEAKKLQSGM